MLEDTTVINKCVVNYVSIQINKISQVTFYFIQVISQVFFLKRTSRRDFTRGFCFYNNRGQAAGLRQLMNIIQVTHGIIFDEYLLTEVKVIISLLQKILIDLKIENRQTSIFRKKFKPLSLSSKNH